MPTSILETVRAMVGPSALYEVFDTDLITHINTLFFTLNQLGVGPDKPFKIEGADEEWSDFMGDQDGDLEAVKSYITLKTRLYFDPPTNSSLLNAMNEQCKELEWRLNVAVDPGETV